MHGGMEQAEREKNLNIFREKKSGWLIATDVTARGIDLPGITHVINYDIPDEPENYVHRIGRTGRGFAKGEAISFYSSEEKEKLAAIESFLETKINRLKVDKHHLQPVEINQNENSFAQLIADEEQKYNDSKRRKKIKKES